MKNNKMLGSKIFLVLFIIILFIPLYWMFIGSLQDINGVMVMPPNPIPYHPTLDNYKYLLEENALIWLKNTLIVVGGTIITSIILSLTAGYSFAIYNFKLKGFILIAFMSQLMLPRISLLIPYFVILRDLHLSGTIIGIILTTSFSPMGIYLAKNYFESIPKSIIESARIDGASELQILFRIVAPISKPIVSALSLFAGIGALQDYLWQMLVLQVPEKQTLLVGLIRRSMARGMGADMGINPVGRSFAVGILLFLPLLIIFLIANKYFTESLGGAVKE